jgi:hypothetical protein
MVYTQHQLFEISWLKGRISNSLEGDSNVPPSVDEFVAYCEDRVPSSKPWLLKQAARELFPVYGGHKASE